MHASVDNIFVPAYGFDSQARGQPVAESHTSVKISTATMIKSLQVRPFCDSSQVDDLSATQQAALHVFQYEVLAAYYRVQMVVPESKIIDVLDKKFNRSGK